MSTEDFNERIARLEVKVNLHEKKLEVQDKKNDTLTRLVTLYETQERAHSERELRQLERDKKQQEQLDKFGNAMEEVVVSLANINHTQQQLKEDMGEIGNRVADIEKSQEESKIDPIKIFLKILAFGGTLLGGILAAWLYMQLGLK